MSVDYVDFSFVCFLSIDFVFLLNIMLLEPEKWIVPKCSTIQNFSQKGDSADAAGQTHLAHHQAGNSQKSELPLTAGYLPIRRISRTPTPTRSGSIPASFRGKKEWELVEIFADEGLSGMNAQNRTEFQRMIKMCEQHQIDLIVTKVRLPLRPKRQGVSRICPKAEIARRGGAVRERGNLHSGPRR